MLIDSVALHDELAPIVEKLELLSQLAPVLDSDREFACALTVILNIIADYVGQLRHRLDALVSAGESQEGGRA